MRRTLYEVLCAIDEGFYALLIGLSVATDAALRQRPHLVGFYALMIGLPIATIGLRLDDLSYQLLLCPDDRATDCDPTLEPDLPTSSDPGVREDRVRERS